jgi:uncharacterized phage infection (PIP) family protein YhgE
MRIRLLAAGALTVATLAACSSSGGTTSGTGSTGTGAGGVTTSSTPMSSSMPMSSDASGGGSPQAFCGELKSAQQKLTGLANGLGTNPAQAGNKLDPIISELQQLKADAPAQLQSQFGDLASAFQQIKQAGGGGASNLQKIANQLQKLSPKLEKDGKAIEHYLATNCAGS